MIAARALTLVRAGRALVDRADFTLEAGRFTVIIGPNGAGKSTLLKMISGETTPTEGGITYDGRALSTLGPQDLARRRGVLPQSVAIAFPFTALEIVAMGAEAHGALDNDGAARRALARVDLDGFADRIYQDLSGGEQQRVQFARVLAQLPRPIGETGPCAMLLDEPTASLDLGHQIALLEIAAGYARAGGAVLAILHDLNLAAEFADQLIVMHRGRIVACGAPQTTLSDALVDEVYGIRGSVGRLPSRPIPFVLPQARERSPASGTA